MGTTGSRPHRKVKRVTRASGAVGGAGGQTERELESFVQGIPSSFDERVRGRAHTPPSVDDIDKIPTELKPFQYGSAWADWHSLFRFTECISVKQNGASRMCQTRGCCLRATVSVSNDIEPWKCRKCMYKQESCYTSKDEEFSSPLVYIVWHLMKDFGFNVEGRRADCAPMLSHFFYWMEVQHMYVRFERGWLALRSDLRVAEDTHKSEFRICSTEVSMLVSDVLR